MTNRGRLSFNQTEEIILLPTTVNINKYYMANILYFSEVTNIKRVHIKMDTSKEKLINVHIKDGKLSISKHVWRVFSTQTLMTQVLSSTLLMFPLIPTVIY